MSETISDYLPTIPAPAPLRRTALHATHHAHKARMVDFGGWDMPVQYRGLIDEHMAVRTGVGVFDVSHMGDIQLRGPNSLAAVQKLLMNDASKLQVGQAHYSAMLYPNGTFVDDVILHKLGENDYLIVINAGTREKDVQWVRKTLGGMGGLHITDVSDYYTQIAIQGPKAQATLQKLTPVDLAPIKNYWFTWGQVCGLYNVLIARTGYTGEDGFEIYVPADEATSARVWGEVLAGGRGVRDYAVRAGSAEHAAAGVGDGAVWARDFGHDECVGGESRAVLQDGQGRGFCGARGAAGGAERGGPAEAAGRARDGGARDWARWVCGVFAGGRKDWRGDERIARAVCEEEYCAGVCAGEFVEPGTEVAVEVRGQKVKAVVVPTPFYKRAKTGTAAAPLS